MKKHTLQQIVLLGLLAVLLIPCATVFGQQNQDQIPDTIFLLNRKKLMVRVENISSTKVFYKSFDKKESQSIERKKVEKVVFKNGRKEIMNKPALSVVSSSSWKAVLVTENTADIEGLYKRGLVKSKASASSTSIKAAKKSATIRLQKKTANIGGVVVLVTRYEAIGGYGDNPGYEMDGIAYGYDPVADSIANKVH
jgi:hypothetical protein